MRETEYTYAVARIRANEQQLLTSNDINQLISADSYAAAKQLLTAKGWKDSENICEDEISSALEMIKESTKDDKLTEALVIGNDFTNLKAAVKAFFSGIDATGYMTYPCVCEPSDIIEAVKVKDFSLLPDYLAVCAEKAFNAVSEENGGQKAEIIIDKAAFETRYSMSEECGSPLLEKITGVYCIIAAIKIALRSAKTGKTKEFALEAMPDNKGLIDKEALIDAAFAGEKLADIVSEAGYNELAGYADGNFTLLETEGDNYITSLARSKKSEIYGADPVVAYYYAKLAEIKNVRIILSAKQSGVPEDIIKERVRELYV